jgi:hypothetical protein
MPDGSEKSISFKKENDRYILDCNANILDPVVIFFKK